MTTTKEKEEEEEVIVVMMTAPDEQTAKKIARTLVQEKLVACCNLILKGVESVFEWEGVIHDSESEVLIHAKSKKSSFPRIVDRVKQIHPYQVPEIIAVPVIFGNKEYLDWVKLMSTPSK